MHIGTTITQFIIEEQRRIQKATGDFTSLINDIVIACKAIADAVNHGNLAGVLGSAETENIQGETQKKLDVISNDLFIKCNQWGGHVAAMASEEMEEIYHIPERYPRGKYLLVFDPLDGSTNIDVNGTVGTIFSIVRCPQEGAKPTTEDFLQPGTAQVAAGFVIYGPSTILVLTTGNGVNGFTLNRDIGEFLLSHPNMTIPQDTNEFAINMSNHRFWAKPVQRYVDECVQGKNGPRDKDFNMRWVGAMIADVYRVLCRGGIFLYPWDSKDSNKPGKLRLLYEANPASFVVEQAGGISTTGTQRTMEIQPSSLHQRVPLILGSKHEVERIVAYHREG